jgi:PAS domain S-box-containing protein
MAADEGGKLRMNEERNTVLVVDDEPLSVKILCHQLENEYTLIFAHGGREALDVISSTIPDIILLDLLMPDIDGYEVYRNIRMNPALDCVPVLFITAQSSDECEARGLKMGAHDFIHKPFAADLVRLRINNHLAFSQQRSLLLKRSLELQEVNESYRRQFADNTTIMLLIDPADGLIIDANTSALRYYGYSRNQFISMNISEINVLSQSEVKQKIDSVTPEQGKRFEFQHRLADGSIREVEVSSSRIQFGSRQVLHSIIFDVTDRKKAEKIQRSYAHRLIQIEENLRGEIATELHDEIGRDLAALGINMSIIGQKLNDGDTDNISLRIRDCGQLIEGISRTTRNVIANLRPPVLDDFGLLLALQWHTAIFSARTGLSVSISADETFPRINAEKEMILFRIAQEALTNVAKYADAKSVTISLSNDDRKIKLIIKDDGKGFVPGSSSQIQGSAGWGTTIMRERAELIGGIFTLDSSQGEGTTVSVEALLE